MVYLSRIVSLKGFDNVLLGRDLAKALKPGMVYGIRDIMGIITLEELGPHASFTHRGNTVGQIASNGRYCLTEEEFAAQQEAEET